MALSISPRQTGAPTLPGPDRLGCLHCNVLSDTPFLSFSFSFFSLNSAAVLLRACSASALINPGVQMHVFCCRYEKHLGDD